MNIPKSPYPRVALIAGPTASGKSALAVALAEHTEGVVINADSAQVYADLHILSARPDEDDIGRVPHRLYGYRDGANACSAADWAADARREIAEVHAGGRLPILVGGTGLYLRTLIDGIAPVPSIDPDVRKAVRAMPVKDAHVALAAEDPAAAARLHPTDTTRIARALEVMRSTGRPLSEWQKLKEGGIGDAVTLMPLILLPPREWLYARCDQRFEAMLGPAGLIEGERLMARQLDPALPVMRAIGVPQVAALLRGELTRAQALVAGQAATRQYAKRQYTWFSHQPPPEWPRFAEVLEGEAIERAISVLRAPPSSRS